MKSWTSSFERGSRPVVGSSRSNITGEVSRARASATFCCIPRDRFSIGSRRRSWGKPTRVRISGILSFVSLRAHPVEARGVAQVLDGGHLLEEGGLHRDPVDEPANLALVLEDVVTEDLGGSAVVQQQRREKPDQGRLARAVLAQDRERLTALHREGDALQRGNAAALAPPALTLAPVAADELLPQLADLERRHGCRLRRRGHLEAGRVFGCLDHRRAPGGRRVRERARSANTQPGARTRIWVLSRGTCREPPYQPRRREIKSLPAQLGLPSAGRVRVDLAWAGEVRAEAMGPQSFPALGPSAL